MFLYKWFSKYRLIEHLKRSVTSKKTGTRTNEVTTIAWCTLSSLDNNALMTVYILNAKFKSLPTFKRIQYEKYFFFSRDFDE